MHLTKQKYNLFYLNKKCIMADRAKDFIDNFTKAINLIIDNAPKDLSICISLYARDCSDRTKEEPDGKICMSSFMRCGYFDQVTFKEYVNRFFSQ